MAEHPDTDSHNTEDRNPTLSEGNTTGQIPVQSDKRSGPDLHIRHYGFLPLNKGHGNGFVGEMNDAGVYALAWSLCRYMFPGLKYEPTIDRRPLMTAKPLRNGRPLLQARPQPILYRTRTTAALIRGAYAGTGSLALYTSLSLIGFDYRSWIDPVIESELDPEIENMATKATAAGAILGLVLGIPIVKYPERAAARLEGITPRLLPLKKVPLTLGSSCVLALSFNMIAQILPHSRRAKP